MRQTDSNYFVEGVTDKYERKLLAKRPKIEGEAICCLLSDLCLYDEVGLDTKDFISKDGRYLFQIIKELRKRGYEEFSETDINSVVSELTDDIQEWYSNVGGYSEIERCSRLHDDSPNYHIYIDNLYRDNLFLKMTDSGIDLFKKIKIGKDDVVPYDEIIKKSMTTEEVIDFYTEMLLHFDKSVSNKVIEEGYIEFTDENLQKIQEGELRGISISYAGTDVYGKPIPCFPWLDDHLGGYFQGTFNAVAGHSSVGKSTFWTSVIMSMISQGHKVIIISNEQNEQAFINNFLCWLVEKYFHYNDENHKFGKAKLRKGDLTDEDVDIYRKAQKFWDEHFKKKVYFSLIPDADTNAVKRIIRQKNLSEGFDVVIYDTLKADFTKTNDSDAIWISLIKDSREFEKLAKKYDLIFLCSLQLAMSTKNKLFIDGGEISSSKQVIETMESLLLLRSVYKEEFDKDNKHCFCSPKIRQKNAEGKYVEYEYVSDTEKSYKMIFVGKSRNGANSNETGKAYLLEFNGDLGTFKEVAYCTPKHSEIRS